jgi:hypothetical protein
MRWRSATERYSRGAPAARASVSARGAPAAAAELSRAERDLGQASLGEAELLAMARRLHDVAYPLSTTERMKESA